MDAKEIRGKLRGVIALHPFFTTVEGFVSNCDLHTYAFLLHHHVYGKNISCNAPCLVLVDRSQVQHLSLACQELQHSHQLSEFGLLQQLHLRRIAMDSVYRKRRSSVECTLLHVPSPSKKFRDDCWNASKVQVRTDRKSTRLNSSH